MNNYGIERNEIQFKNPYWGKVGKTKSISSMCLDDCRVMEPSPQSTAQLYPSLPKVFS